MTNKKRRQVGLGWAVSLVLMVSGVVATAGAGSATADDGSTPSPTGSTTGSPTGDPAGSPTGDPAAEPSGAPSGDSTFDPGLASSSGPTTPPTPSPSTARVAPVAPATRGARVVRGHYTPPDGVLFNYPYSGNRARYVIRKHALRTIKSTPTGGSIRIAAYSVNDWTTVHELIKAKKRGVSVQVVVNAHNLHGTPNHGSSPPFQYLHKILGPKISRKGQDPERISFAKICHNSCRGSGGNVHYKMFLFSSAGGPTGTAKSFITMTGSPNLTYLAAQGQWNHLITYSNQQTYERYRLMFNEMKLDHKAALQYHDYEDITPPTWFFPRPATHASTDPQMIALRNVRCTGVAPGYGNGSGRTLIRAGAYAFFGERGNYIARRLRELWNQGCDVAVEYAVIGNTVKKILYSPSGRGRIPMRQVATFNNLGVVVTYDHAKYLTVNGAYGASNGTTITWTGTTNWTNLGFYSDDFTQVWANNDPLEAAFRANFNRIWKGPKSHPPSPTSHLPKGVGDRIPLGKGPYRNMETS